jgi:hypothetical protein
MWGGLPTVRALETNPGAISEMLVEDTEPLTLCGSPSPPAHTPCFNEQMAQRSGGIACTSKELLGLLEPCGKQ